MVLIELGTCSIRAGFLTNRPSLPLTFFPAVGCVVDNNETDCQQIHIGIDAFKPEIRKLGKLQSPIQVKTIFLIS